MMVIVEQSVQWKLAGETEIVGENLPQRHFVHHKSQMTRLGSNSGRRDWTPELWRGSLIDIENLINYSIYEILYTRCSIWNPVVNRDLAKCWISVRQQRETIWSTPFWLRSGDTTSRRPHIVCLKHLRGCVIIRWWRRSLRHHWKTPRLLFFYIRCESKLPLLEIEPNISSVQLSTANITYSQIVGSVH
jgi:hypothetical protein